MYWFLLCANFKIVGMKVRLHITRPVFMMATILISGFGLVWQLELSFPIASANMGLTPRDDIFGFVISSSAPKAVFDPFLHTL